MKTLKEYLIDWEDMDVAAYMLAMVMGIIPDDDGNDGGAGYRKHKALFWSANPLSEMLYPNLQGMVEAGILEENNDQKVRWCSNYIPSI